MRESGIWQGDCREELAKLPAESVALAFADPPFNIKFRYDVYDDGQSREDYLRFSREWIAGVTRLLRPDGAFWVAIGDEYAAELKLLLRDQGLHCVNWVVWYYTFGMHCTRRFARSHTHLLYFVKDPARYVFNDLEVRVPSARMTTYADGRADPRGRLPDNTWVLRPQDAPDSFAPGDDTWYFPRVAGTFKERRGFHGCQMPERLLGRIVRLCSNPGDRVLDPFAGSGTTLAVAKKLGREPWGIDLSADYVRLGSERLAGVKPGDPLAGAPDPVVSAPSTPRLGKRRRRVPPATEEAR